MKKILILTLTFVSAILFAQNNTPWQQQNRETPPARSKHSMVEINGMVYMFGGEDNAMRDILNDLWCYTEGNSTWGEKTPSNPPSPRKYPAATKTDGKMYVFGGYTPDGTVMDIWEYDPVADTWMEKPSASTQDPKLFYTATAGDNKIWITCGIDDATNEVVAETWGYDVSTGTWEQVADCPSPRYGHAAFFSDGKLIICSGRRGLDFLDDMWSYDVSGNTWTEIIPQGTPDGVKFPAYDNNSEVLWMAGGTSKDENGYFDSDKTYEYDIAGNTWTQKPDGPAFTFGAGAILPNSKKSTNTISPYKAVIFGGTVGGVATDETWIFDSETGWQQTSLPEIEIGNKPNLVSVFPTYTTGQVNIKSKKNIQEVAVYNMHGQLLQTQKINTTELTIDLSENMPGVYFVNVYCNNVYTSAKVILRR